MALIDRLIRRPARAPGLLRPPVYHYHLMKTGGTSLNHAFCAEAFDPDHDALRPAGGEAGPDDPGRAVYRAVMRSPGGRLAVNRHVLVGFHKETIERGGFTFAFSHVPHHQLTLPPGCLTVTVLRDPLDRIVSRFNHWYSLWRRGRLGHYQRLDMAPLIEKGFGAFLDAAEPEELAHQLHFYSADGDPMEALDRLRQVDLVLFTDRLGAGLEILNRRIGSAVRLPETPAKQAQERAPIAPQELDRARALLDAEFRFVGAVQALRGGDPAIVRR